MVAQERSKVAPRLLAILNSFPKTIELEEVKELLAIGFEYVKDHDGVSVFRRRIARFL